ncbi:MAG: YicC family protein, partial [Phycisphaerae bacterium]
NHRYLKLTFKLPEQLQHGESVLEGVVRSRVSRGSLAITVRMRGNGAALSGVINLGILQHYVNDLLRVELPEGVRPTVDLGSVANLPGVCDPPDVDDSVKASQRQVLRQLVEAGIGSLLEMRRTEGQALHEDMLEMCRLLRGEMAVIERYAPLVVEEYHERLKSRVDLLMRKGGFELEVDGLMREVAIYAERCDIREELTRLGAHLDQFVELCDRDEPAGRTLDFLAQELLREANTIASKSNDARIARSVVTIKGLIDRLKEQVQNVE